MSVLRLRPRHALEYRLDLSPLTPDRIAGQTLAAIKRIRLVYGGETIRVADLFAVTGRAGGHIRIEQGSEKLSGVGQGMQSGRIEIAGNVGDLVGRGMTGGSIQVTGDAGAWAGSGLAGGRIEIAGNAGDYAGAGRPGDRFGMRGGLLHIGGQAGDRAGDRMRRGMIIIRGRAGDYCASRIHAGTVIVMGRAGSYPAAGMRRGSLILAKKPARLSATFKNCGDLKMQFLRLLFTQLANMGDDLASFRQQRPTARRFSGDLALGGKGEILILGHY